ncbi:hypothetical protein [Pseudogulbenkiania ferrooxidans]|uniref:Uncharacterized protein n=1 Tax=Pseudogulbenkiania ferrooxidans 2002 TaxID=279714 RepID=B9Z326_9NEIS|nr:hypothetical protein [Pseudogulbenkiania ferrooxidans]EEG08979.1 hypothetical protein FuraDRAFT_1739 [Pseudogulbenkiania ferrooxidans 2002]
MGRIVDQVRDVVDGLAEFSAPALRQRLEGVSGRQIAHALGYLLQLGEIRVLRVTPARAGHGAFNVYAKAAAFRAVPRKVGRRAEADQATPSSTAAALALSQALHHLGRRVA